VDDLAVDDLAKVGPPRGGKHHPDEYSGIVYDPPTPDLPYIAVIFRPGGEILSARAVPSAEAGRRLIRETFGGLARARAEGKF
jgi:hypothetical protein